MKPLITICTVNYNSAEFVEMMLYSFSLLTKNSYQVIIRDNGSREKDYKKLQSTVARYSNVSLYRTEVTSSGSMAHGEALNDLVSKIDTEYGVILDADAIFLKKNWDEELVSRMDENMPIFGTQADPGKPQDFPLMYAVIFKSRILQRLEIDFRPTDPARMLDTGWRMREECARHGFRGGLLYGFNTRTYKTGPFANIICTEYYLSEKGVGNVFASHFGRGSAPQAKNLIRMQGKNLLIKAANKVLSYVNVYKWKQDKTAWIRKCNSIINSQK